MVEDSVCRPPCGSAKLLTSNIDKYDFMSLKQVEAFTAVANFGALSGTAAGDRTSAQSG